MNKDHVNAFLHGLAMRIEGDIHWLPDRRNSLAFRFRADVRTSDPNDHHIEGWYNPDSEKLTFTLFRPDRGRIYGLCMGISHPELDIENPRRPHKHYWTDARRDRNRYLPDDISADWTNPAEVWSEFRQESHLEHDGQFYGPPNLLEVAT